MLAPVDIEDGGNQSVHQEKTLESTGPPTTNNDCKGERVGFFSKMAIHPTVNPIANKREAVFPFSASRAPSTSGIF